MKDTKIFCAECAHKREDIFDRGPWCKLTNKDVSYHHSCKHSLPKAYNEFSKIDKKLYKLGFLKLREDEYGASYEREVDLESSKYKHRVDILHEADGHHLIQSYDSGIRLNGFNVCAGTEISTMKLFLKKCKEIQKKYDWKTSK